VGPPRGHKPCQKTCSSVGSSLHRSTGPARSLLQCRLSTGSQPPLGTSTSSGVGSSIGCRWISAPPWTSMGCGRTAYLSVVFSIGCKGISAPVPGAPPPPPSSLTLVSAELFLSYCLTPLSCCSFFLSETCYHRGATIADGLGLGLRCVHLGTEWHWLCRTWGKLLAASH